MNNFRHKKIGIWGFGVVGKSILTYFDQQIVTQIQILDSRKIILPETKTPCRAIIQTQQSIQDFLEYNDFILASPGIPLHNYQNFSYKFINELDLLQNNISCSTIAITGTVGKTSITSLLEYIIKQTYPKTIAYGNIGNPMISLINDPQDIAIIELSSFQLQPTQLFAPDLAVITNFFPNHLDHHQSIEEYFEAKCNILKYQTHYQQALIPLNLVDSITNIIPLKEKWALFSTTKPNQEIAQKFNSQNIYYLKDKLIYIMYNNKTQHVFDCNTLPRLTFDTNWLVIIAVCHLYKIDITNISQIVQNLVLPDHRVQKIGSHKGSNFYNDSKSTVWQATLQAVESMGNKPIMLFLGGLSKGADRTPLFQALAGKNIVIYNFGKEANHLAQLCTQFNITHYTHKTLDTSWEKCINNLTTPHEILFSPGGSSFDLFTDYKARGKYFTKLFNLFYNK